MIESIQLVTLSRFRWSSFYRTVGTRSKISLCTIKDRLSPGLSSLPIVNECSSKRLMTRIHNGAISILCQPPHNSMKGVHQTQFNQRTSTRLRGFSQESLVFRLASYLFFVLSFTLGSLHSGLAVHSLLLREQAHSSSNPRDS